MDRLNLNYDKVKTGNDGLSHYEMSADNTEWEAYYGLRPGKDSTGEFFMAPVTRYEYMVPEQECEIGFEIHTLY